MKKSGGPPQTRVDVRLPSTQWIPGRVAVDYVHRRLPGYSPASVSALLLSAAQDREIKVRYQKDLSVITVRDLFFKRDSLEVWTDKVAPCGPEQDAGKSQSAAKFGADEEALYPKSADSMKKMIIGMAMAKYGYDPTAERNKAAAEITADLVRLGLSLDPDTVRKWLREAADCLPRTDVADL